MTIINTDRPITRVSLFTFFALGAVAAALTWLIIHSTSPPTDPSERYTIRHSWEVEEIASDSAVAWNALSSKRFNDYAKKHGWNNDIKFINFVGDIQRKHVSSVIAGEGADIMLATLPEAAYYADRGMIEPLDEYVNGWEDYQNGQIDKAALDSCRGPDGKLLGLTIYGSGPSFYSIRRDWLDNLGLSIPTTFEQARAVWRAFTFDDPDGDNKQNTYGYAMTMETELGQHATWGISPFMIAAGVEYYRLNEDGNIVPTFNTPEAAEVLDLIKTCFKEGLFGDDAMYRKKPPAFLHFSAKKAGMDGNYRTNYYKNLADSYGMYDKVKIIPFVWKDEQSRNDKRYHTWVRPTRLRCMMRTSRNKEAAWRYLKFFFSREQFGLYFNARGEPSGRSMYLGRFGLVDSETPWQPLRNDIEFPNSLDEETIRLVSPLNDYASPAPNIPSWSQISIALSEVFVDYYLDRYPDARVALDEAEKRFREVIEKYRRAL